jgi:predicted metal-binding membrane protein
MWEGPAGDVIVHQAALTQEASSRRGGAGVTVGAPVVLLVLAAVGWWWSHRMASPAMGGMDEMTSMQAGMSLGAFVVAWVAMMAAMMFPAVLPVVRLYGHAVARGRAAPTGFFVLGYLAVWAAMAGPAYFAWRALAEPLADGRPWVARLAGATFLLAGAWQLTPLKSACLRHCRSPLGFFLRFGGMIRRPLGAMRMGATHGAFCFGCCWAIFAVLVVLGTMNLAWMAALTALIVLEKNSRHGEGIALAAGAALAIVGALLLVDSSVLVHLT